MTKGCIYKITNAITGKVYVGSTVNFSQRSYRHKRELKAGTHSIKLQHSWKKHGESAFVFEVIEEVEEKQSLNSREQFWIDLLDAANVGYNMTPTAGSLRGHKLTAKTKARISAAVKESWTPEKKARMSARVVSAETREKKSKAMILALQSPEARRAIGDRNRGRVQSAESNEKRRLAHTGKVMSEESRQKMSESQKLLMTPERLEAMRAASMGKKASAETKRKLSEMRRGVKKSDAHRAAMSLAAKARYARLREAAAQQGQE